MDEDLQQKIAAALERNVPMSAIAEHLASHENPAYRSYGESWLQTQAQPETRRSDYQEPQKNLAQTITPMLDIVNEYPKTALAIGAAAVGGTAALKAYNAYEDRKMRRELQQSELEKNRAYSRQVELQAQKLTPGQMSPDQIANAVKQEQGLTGVGTPNTQQFENQFGQTNLTPEDLRARTASMPQAPITTPVAGPAVGPAVPPEFDFGGVSPANAPALPPVATPLDKAPLDAPAPLPSAAPNSPVTSIVADTVKDLMAEAPPAGPLQPVPPEELRTGTGKPAFPGQGPAVEVRKKGKLAGEPMLRNSYARIEDVPAGYAFVPGAQNIDTSRANIGQAEYTKAYSQRPFPLTSEAAVLESSEINRILGRPTRPEAKAAGITLPPQTPGVTKAVLESKASPFMGTKAAKVGGVLGALIAIPDLAKAETVGQRGMAGANLLEAVLPPGFTMTGAGEGSTLPSNIAELQRQSMLLGSPYAQSDIARKRRQDQEYALKVGGGRGFAPPSAYKR